MANKHVTTKGAYSAYETRDVPCDDVELTRVGPGTDCGEYLRRFWQPICFSGDLTDVPLRIRILGEDLVVFRDLSGRIGLLQLHCSHRGTSLEFGLIAKRGIRCCYHGWLYDVDGTILETPGEPSTSTLKNRVCHGAYPTHEYEGLVFAYMGPPDKRPAFPILDTYDIPGYYNVPYRHVFPCNWLQIKENCMDMVHNYFLHAQVAGIHFTEAFNALSELEWLDTRIGMACIQSRRVNELVWIRINDFLVPNIHQFPPSEEALEERSFVPPLITVWDVPVDDINTTHIGLMHLPEGVPPDDPVVDTQANFGMDGNRSYEARQRQPGDFDAQVSQRPIAIHALEHLGATDRGVIMLRKLVTAGIRAVKSGQVPDGLTLNPGEPIETHSRNTVLRIPAASTDEKDRELIREAGRQIFTGDCTLEREGTSRLPLD